MSQEHRLLKNLSTFFLKRTGDNTVDGSIYPANDLVDDLGAIGQRWRFGYFGSLYAEELDVRQIKNIAIRPNLLRNGGFEQADAEHSNQPIAWVGSADRFLLTPLAAEADDANFPTESPAASNLLMGVG